MNLRIFDTAAGVDQAIARTIVQRASKRTKSAIAISGGSTPIPLYEMLAGEPELADREITWVVVDERYVPSTDAQSNARMIRGTLFRDGLPPRHRFLEFKTDIGDPLKTVAQFQTEWLALGLDILDVILLGVGEDGHTASLFPGTEVLDVEEGLAAAVYVPRLEQWRVTLTLPVIRAAKLRIVQVVGETKAGVVAGIARGADYPVTRATSGEGESWWFLDQAAAGQLSGT